MLSCPRVGLPTDDAAATATPHESECILASVIHIVELAQNRAESCAKNFGEVSGFTFRVPVFRSERMLA